MNKALATAMIIIAALLGACKTGAGPQRPDPLAETDGLTTAQRQVLEARVRASNSHDWDSWEALHTESCVRTAPELDHPLVGSKAMRAALVTLAEAFPDYHVALVRAVGHGDWVMAEFTSWGTFTGSSKTPSGFAIPATHRSFFQHWSASVRLEAGRIAEFHEYWDQSDVNDQVAGFKDPKPW